MLLFNAICQYAFDGIYPQLTGNADDVWNSILPIISKPGNKSIKLRKPAFTAPTLEEVCLYVQSKNPTAQKDSVREFAEKFWSFYESNGWMVGKNKMKNWMAAIRTWKETMDRILFNARALPEFKKGSLEHRQLEYLKGYELIKNDPNL